MKQELSITIEIDLGNEAMQSSAHVVEAIAKSLKSPLYVAQPGKLQNDDSGNIFDVNGNLVGKWSVSDGS